MIANGTFVGIVAAVVGTIVGILGWMLAAGAVESAANHRINRFDLPWTLIIAVALLAVVMATLAAWWPARAATRLPVMTALSGRPALPRPVHRSVAVAIGLLVIGVTCVVLAHPTSTHFQPWLLVIGLLAIVTSSVFSAPAAIRMLGPLARRLPFAPRLALRDLARYQSRAAAALAAITLGLGIAVSVVAIAAANQNRSDQGNLSNRELLIEVGDIRTTPNPLLTAAEVQQLDKRADSIVSALGEGFSSTPLDVAFNSDKSQQAIHEPVSLGAVDGPHSIKLISYPYIASPALLHLYGIDPNTIRATTEVVTAHSGPLLLIDFSKRIEPGSPPVQAQHVSLPSYSSAPNSLITPATVLSHGWASARAAWIVELPRPLTAAQLKSARAAAVSAGLAIEVRSQQDGLATLRTDATLIGGLLALAIVAMAVGLIRGESRRDILTLTATGASATTRRALTASTAAALAALGVLLAVCGAYTALIAAYRSDLGKLAPLPLAHLLALIVGLPAIATAAGWLLAGKEPTSFARQALD
jgi:putative ABC transport system permease protein